MTQQFQFWEYIQRNPKHYLKKHMHPYVHCSIIYNSQDREATLCPSIDEWIKRWWYMNTIDYYLAMKKKEILPFVSAWMDLEGFRLSEIS